MESKILRALRTIINGSKVNIPVLGAKATLLVEGYNRDNRILGYNFTASSAEDIFNNIDSLKAIICVIQEDFDRDELIAIDVCARRGIPILWFIDKFSVSLDSLIEEGRFLAASNDLNIEDYLFKQGVKLEPSLVMDMQSSSIPQVTGIEGGKAKTMMLPYPYHPLVTANEALPFFMRTTGPLHMSYVTPITVNKDLPGISSRVILSSSAYSQIRTSPVLLDFDFMRVEPKASDYNLGSVIIGVEISGKAKPYFGNRLTGEERKDMMKYLHADKLLTSMTQIIISDASLVSPKSRKRW